MAAASTTPATRSPFGRTFLKSSVVMTALGYSNRAAFWEFVRSAGVPHIRLNSRRIIFDELALNEWLDRRSSDSR